VGSFTNNQIKGLLPAAKENETKFTFVSFRFGEYIK
jgi:hypothetical protein